MRPAAGVSLLLLCGVSAKVSVTILKCRGKHEAEARDESKYCKGRSAKTHHARPPKHRLASLRTCTRCLDRCSTNYDIQNNCHLSINYCHKSSTARVQTRAKAGVEFNLMLILFFVNFEPIALHVFVLLDHRQRCV